MTTTKKNGFWIQIDSIETAKQAANQGFWAAILVAGITTVLAIVAITVGGLPEGMPQIDA